MSALPFSLILFEVVREENARREGESDGVIETSCRFEVLDVEMFSRCFHGHI